ALSLSKLGVGVLVLSGTNTYTGTTAVSNGTLLVNGTHSGSGAFTINNGGALGGSGTITASVDVKNGGTLSPGASIDTLRIGTLMLESGASLTEEINFTSDTADKTVVNGNVDLSGGPTLRFVFLGVTGAPTFVPNRTYIIIDNKGTNPVNGTFASKIPGLG